MEDQPSIRTHGPRTLWVLTAIYAFIGIFAYWAIWWAPDYHAFSFAIALTATLLHGSAAVYYLRGLRHFKTNLRIAYLMLSVGIGMLGIAIAQLSIINLFWLLFWANSGLLLLPYLIAVYLMFGGIRQFAHSALLKSKWFSFRVVTAAAIIVGAVVALLPHASSQLQDEERIGSAFLTTVVAVFFVFALRGTLLIKRVVGASYSHGLAWLCVALLAAIVAAAHYIFVLQWTSSSGVYYNWSAPIVFFNITGWLFMRAGYAFANIDELVRAERYPARWRRFFGLPESVGGQAISSVDIIVYVMGLTSDPTKVDAMVDDMRVITARMGSDEKLTDHDQTTLLRVYKRLEDYLVQHEPLRSFDRQQVRQSVERHFGLDTDVAAKATFWPRLGR
jgi:hypothetical protein